MTVALMIQVVMLGGIVAVAFGSAIYGWRQHRYVKRENARRREEWLDDCAVARDRGRLPPFPPNRLVL